MITREYESRQPFYAARRTLQVRRTTNETMPEYSGISLSAAYSNVCQRQADSVNAETAARKQTHQFVSRLEAHLVEKFGDAGAAVRAQILFDSFGPGRGVDPGALFADDSDGDLWSEAIKNLNF